MAIDRTNLYSESFEIIENFLKENIHDPKNRFKKRWVYASMPNVTAKEFDGYPFIVATTNMSSGRSSINMQTEQVNIRVILDVYADDSAHLDNVCSQIYDKFKEDLENDLGEFKGKQLSDSPQDYVLVNGRKVYTRSIGIVGKLRLNRMKVSGLLFNSTGYYRFKNNLASESGGSLEGWVPISNWRELYSIRNELAGRYYLTRDLSSADDDYAGIGDNWTPIGLVNVSRFIGEFDGRNYTISDLVINQPTLNCSGLFGESSGKISNVGIVNLNYNVFDFGGGLIGYYINGDITNCWATGTINSYYYAGGLIGTSIESATGTISKCYTDVDLTSSRFVVGGFIGSTWGGTIEDCYAKGNVTAQAIMGGFAASINNSANVVRCYSSGLVTVTGTGDNTGGFSGRKVGSPTVADCYWDTETSGYVTSANSETGLTTAEMYDNTNYSNWDFTYTWDGAWGDGYPYLWPTILTDLDSYLEERPEYSSTKFYAYVTGRDKKKLNAINIKGTSVVDNSITYYNIQKLSMSFWVYQDIAEDPTGLTESVWFEPAFKTSTYPAMKVFLTSGIGDLDLRIQVLDGWITLANIRKAGFTRGRWHHFAIVYDGAEDVENRIKVYLNKNILPTPIEYTSQTTTDFISYYSNTPTIINVADSIGVGSITGSDTKINYDTRFDDWSIFKRVLSSSEVAELYDS